MTTKIYYFQGPCEWAKLMTPDSFNEQEKYKINLYMTEEDLQILKDSGARLKVREDEDGKFVTFSRKVRQEIDGKTREFGPPMVIDADGKPFQNLVGNGSIVTCKVSIYDTKVGKGTRLEAVRVEKWVEYVKPEVSSEISEFLVPDVYALSDKPQDAHLPN